jgi:hypothetical protein
MPTTFFPADTEVRAMLDELIEEYRTDLLGRNIRIGLTMAVGENGKPAMKGRGQRILGKCKVNGKLDKTQGKPDADITLDGDYWAIASATRRKALLHHELSHIDLYDGDTDENERPILKSRRGDWDFDGFHEMVQLYGPDSAEAANLAMIAERHRQLGLPFGQASPEPETVGAA